MILGQVMHKLCGSFSVCVCVCAACKKSPSARALSTRHGGLCAHVGRVVVAVVVIKSIKWHRHRLHFLIKSEARHNVDTHTEFFYEVLRDGGAIIEF